MDIATEGTDPGDSANDIIKGGELMTRVDAYSRPTGTPLALTGTPERAALHRPIRRHVGLRAAHPPESPC